MSTFSWVTDSKEAEREQLTLLNLLKTETPADFPNSLEFEVGLAIGTAYNDKNQFAFATAIEFNSAGEPLNKNVIRYQIKVDFPYIPGLLAFRVGPAICPILDKIVDKIDLLIIDGQGIAHPRTFGLASHIGVLYNKPSIGWTRNILYGKHVPPPKGGYSSKIFHPKNKSIIGYAVSQGIHCKSHEHYFISPGHLISTADALTIIRALSGKKLCLPYVLKLCHLLANRDAKIR